MRERITSNAGINGRVYGSFDVVGDTAIVKMPVFSGADAKTAADAIMARCRGVKTVLAQLSKVSGSHRVRGLIHIAGERKTETVHKEHGCLFAVDLEKCYFSPRLSGERLRIANLVQPRETVVNMFAGVGCFSILIAKKVPSAKVYSIDVNPHALEFMERNVRLNRVFERVLPVLGDSKEIVQNRLQCCADRVLMPLPEKAIEYLPVAVSALKPTGGLIHVHLFEHAAKGLDPAEAARKKVYETLRRGNINFSVISVRIIRSTGPNWWQLAADLQIAC